METMKDRKPSLAPTKIRRWVQLTSSKQIILEEYMKCI